MQAAWLTVPDHGLLDSLAFLGPWLDLDVDLSGKFLIAIGQPYNVLETVDQPTIQYWNHVGPTDLAETNMQSLQCA